MKKLLVFICAAVVMTAILCGCAKRAAEDVADKASEVVSDIKDDAEEYGKIEKETDAPDPTLADMDEMMENGRIDDDNDDDNDGDNIDDDVLDKENVQENNDSADDGGDHNDETMSGGSSFL